MKVTTGVLWLLCSATLLGLPALTFATLHWSEGDEGQQMFPGVVVMMLLWLIISPFVLLSTGRLAERLGEGASWLAWRNERPLGSATRTLTFGGSGLLLAWLACTAVADPDDLWGDKLLATYLAAVALYFFALRAASVATAPLKLKAA